MTTKIKRILLLTIAALSMLLTFNINSALALTCEGQLSTKEAIQCGACNSSGSNCQTTPEDSSRNIDNLIRTFINIFSVIVGIVAVVFIVMAGFRYVTSGGDSNRVASAKNSLIYALVGLIIVALAQTIVRFVLHKSTTTATSSQSQQQSGSQPVGPHAKQAK